MAKEWVESYLQCSIYYYTPPDVADAVFGSPCIVGQFFSITAVRKRICEGQGGVWDGATCAFEAPPPPPPVEEPYVVETYLGIDVWWLPLSSQYWASVSEGYQATGSTLEEIRAAIDAMLEYLYPPEDPADGLLAQIIAQVKAWFEPIWTPLNNAWTHFTTVTWPSWTTSFNDLKDSWDEFKTKTWVALTTSFKDLGAAWETFKTETWPDFIVAQTARELELRGYIDEEDAKLILDAEDKAAALESYVDDAVAGVDTVGFFKDPLGYIGTAFNNLISSWAHGITKSFWEGFEEGLTEEG